MAKKEKKLKPVTSQSNILTEDQQAALFFQHKNKIVALREKLASINGEIRAALKVAKSDGFTKKEIDFAISLESDEDENVQKERQRQNQIARWLGVPLGTQGELELEPDRRTAEEKAAAEGKKAGMNGEALKPPYAPGTPEYDAYVENWHVGQSAIFHIQRMKSEAEVLRSEDSEQTDAFDAAADEEFGDDSYRPGDEVSVDGEDMTEVEEDDFEPPSFLRADHDGEDASA